MVRVGLGRILKLFGKRLWLFSAGEGELLNTWEQSMVTPSSIHLPNRPCIARCSQVCLKALGVLVAEMCS